MAFKADNNSNSNSNSKSKSTINHHSSSHSHSKSKNHNKKKEEELDYLISPQLLQHYKNNILSQCHQTSIRKKDFLPHYRARSYPLYIEDNFSKISNDDESDINDDNHSNTNSHGHNHKYSKKKPKIKHKNRSKPLSPNTSSISLLSNNSTSSGSDHHHNNSKSHDIVSNYLVNDKNADKYDKVTDAFELIDDDHCIVGEGTYGVVFRAYSKPNGKDVAVKGIRCDDGYQYQMDERAQNALKQQQLQQQQGQSLNITQTNNNHNMTMNSNGYHNNNDNKTDDTKPMKNGENINKENKDNSDKKKKQYKSLIASRHSSFMTAKLAIKKSGKQFNDQIGIPHTAIQELQTLQRLQHKNIVNLIDVVSNRTFDCVPCNVTAVNYLQLLYKVWRLTNKYQEKYPNLKLPDPPKDTDNNRKEEKSRKCITKIFGALDKYDVTMLENEIREMLYDRSETYHRKRCIEGKKEIPVFYMAFEFMDRDLSSLIKSFSNKQVRLKENIVKYYFKQIMEGLRHCHECGIIHRDIKPSNVLINYSGEVKLCDFGLAFENYSTHSSTTKTNRVVTSWYRPPEILLGQTEYSYHIDIWSASCVFIEMLTMISPFQGQTELDLFRQICNLCGIPNTKNWPNCHKLPWYKKMMEHLNKSKPNNLTSSQQIHYRYKRCILNEPFLKYHMKDDALKFSDFMLVLNPKQRPTANDILCHPYFRNDPKPSYIKIKDINKIIPEEVDKELQEQRTNVRKKKYTKKDDKSDNDNDIDIVDEKKKEENNNNNNNNNNKRILNRERGKYQYKYQYNHNNNNNNNNHNNPTTNHHQQQQHNYNQNNWNNGYGGNHEYGQNESYNNNNNESYHMDHHNQYNNGYNNQMYGNYDNYENYQDYNSQHPPNYMNGAGGGYNRNNNTFRPNYNSSSNNYNPRDNRDYNRSRYQQSTYRGGGRGGGGSGPRSSFNRYSNTNNHHTSNDRDRDNRDNTTTTTRSDRDRDRDRDREKERERDRDRDRDTYHRRNSSRYRRSSSRDKHHSTSSSSHHRHHKSQRSRSRSHKRSKSRSKSHSRSNSKSHSRSRQRNTRTRSKSRSRSRSRQRSRSRSRSR